METKNENEFLWMEFCPPEYFQKEPMFNEVDETVINVCDKGRYKLQVDAKEDHEVWTKEGELCYVGKILDGDDGDWPVDLVIEPTLDAVKKRLEDKYLKLVK